MRSTRVNTFIIGFCCLVFVLFGSALMAQSNEIILTIVMPEWVATNVREDAFSAFEAQHPGVKVVVVNPKDALYFSSPNYDIEEYLNNVEKVVNMADVIYPGMNTEIITPYSTRAGYFLDLSPIVNSDMTLNPEDFYQVAWEAHQWDRGIWALPMAVSPSFLIYSQTMFDNLGLTYPNESWTIDDFAHAQRLLRQEDASGNITDPGFLSFGNENMNLLRGFLGRNFIAPGTDSLQPDFTSPDMENLLTTWIEYYQDGLLGNWQPQGNFSFDMANIPLSISQSYMLTLRNQENILQGSLLPGGVAPVMVAPVAVSAGTQYPELAYELAKFMASDITAFDIIRDGSPARRSLEGQEEASGMVTFSPETEALIEQALENGVSISHMIFSSYIGDVLRASQADDFPGLSIALQEAEQKALDDLQIAESRRNQVILAVATPVPTPSLSEGQIAIDFGINNMSSDLINEDLWNQLVDDFIASNPQVGRVTVKADFLYSAEQMAERYDCFYLPFNATTANTSSILSLDPFFDTDMNFDRNGFLGTVLQQVQHDNRTWAYPIDLKPEFMWYHQELFSQAGIPSPENGWTVSEFVDALTALKLADSESKPFTPRSYGSNTYLLMLMAAYGGVPFDYRTTPATVNLTAPETVDAIRQVLDLAKNGYIEYEALSLNRSSSGGGVMMAGMTSGGSETAIYNETISPYTFQIFSFEGYENHHRMTTYPSGTQYTPIAYDIGTAYISATNQNPEACYKWITTIAQNPALFNSVPAQRSNMDNAALLASTGSSMGDYIQQLDMLLSSPTTIEFPSGQSSATASVENMLRDSFSQIWFNDALDAYVLEENVDLEQELAKAEQYINEYMACQANIPAVDQNLNIYDENPETIEKIEQVYKDYIRCVVQVDDTLYSALSYLLDN